jgi:hypothetical protein
VSVRAVIAGRIALDARALECHAAKVTLGHTPGASVDLFWLTGSAVDINVRSAKDGFDLAITACALVFTVMKDPKHFRVREGAEVKLRKWPTNAEPLYRSKEHYQELLADHVARLSSLQQLLYASNRFAVLPFC